MVLASLEFCIGCPEKTIYIDPLSVIDPVPADYILITRSHADHFSTPDIMKIVKGTTTIVHPKSVKIYSK